MRCGWKGALPAPGIRTIRDMRSVLADPGCPASDPLYYMYRDLARSPADRRWLINHRLRYDITVIPPRDLCGEHVKTKGHYHPANPAGTGYPELYEVLEGTAQFLLQSRKLDDVILVHADTGSRLIIPPGYGHITINPSPGTTLVLANLVSTAFESEYRGVRGPSRGGILRHERRPDRRKPALPGHAPGPEICRCPGKGSSRRSCAGPIYAMIGDQDALAFLNEPEKYPAVFTGL